MQVIWTRESLKRLKEIKDYISRDSPKRAVSFIDFLIEQGDMLKDHPKIGRIVPEIESEKIREIIARKYRIIYRLTKNRIEILTIFEGHRLLRPEDVAEN